ncbi:MAG: iron-containing alcohol dehydrogenase [Candidatus Thermoplasmatota archaeon]|nr:iron-containing alcohol dehydrogenase [Candidatus Thermoplasmatota archaeon]
MNHTEYRYRYDMDLRFDQVKRIIFGKNMSKTVGKELSGIEKKNVLIVTDPNVHKFGLLNEAVESISSSGIRYEIYEDISNEPTMENIVKAVSFARENGKFDSVLGIGGGSVLDTSKMVASMITNPGEPKDYLTPVEDRFKNPGVPKILIPTTGGTGSEVSNMSVVIEKDTMYKTWAASSNLLADTALVDPVLNLSAPPRTTAASGMDALAHNVEGLISKEANAISDGMATKAATLISNNLRTAYNDPGNIEARSSMSMGAMLGGMVITYPWVAGPSILGHCLGEAFGPKYGAIHGVAVGLSLPYILDFNISAAYNKISSLARIFGVKHKGESPRTVAAKIPSAIITLLEDLEMPTTLKDINFPKGDIEKFANYIFESRQKLYDLPRFNPRRLTKENSIRLITNMFDGTFENYNDSGRK